MRLLFLSKRSPQQRDLLTRPYGRFHHIPVALAKAGHQVRVVLIGHAGNVAEDQDRFGVLWQCRDIRGQGFFSTLATLDKDARDWKPDWLIGCSDAWVACLAQRLASKCGARLAVDAYDDFESYMPWNLALHLAYRRAVRAADLVLAAGPQLAALLDRYRQGKTPTKILPMAADPNFVKLDRSECRASLGLPLLKPIVGYYGGWGASRGTCILLPTFRRVRELRPDAILALSGRPPAHFLSEPGVCSLGYLEDSQLPSFVNSLDVSAVVTADTRFGRGSYPAKLCEAMACSVPIAATETEPVKWMLAHEPSSLAPIANPDAFARVIVDSLSKDRVDYGPLPHWRGLASDLDDLLTAAASQRT